MICRDSHPLRRQLNRRQAALSSLDFVSGSAQERYRWDNIVGQVGEVTVGCDERDFERCRQCDRAEQSDIQIGGCSCGHLRELGSHCVRGIPTLHCHLHFSNIGQHWSAPPVTSHSSELDYLSQECVGSHDRVG